MEIIFDRSFSVSQTLINNNHQSNIQGGKLLFQVLNNLNELQEMDRKKSFTEIEIEQIKKLIFEKLTATTDKQKVIRAEIRKIGFHFSDFSPNKDGYTVADFEALIHSGEINVIGDDVQLTLSTKVSKIVSKSPGNYISSQQNKNSFEPLVDDNTEILILGTMPGDRSLSVGEYYSHSGNRFWKIIARITANNIPISYDDKKTLLKRLKIGLWDVAKMAERQGSLDSNILNEIPNDLYEFLDNYPNIRIIGLNGSKAANFFEKFFKKRPNIVYHNLSSTSGANTSIKFEESCKDWKRILK